MVRDGLQSIKSIDRKYQGEGEQADSVSDDVIPQQRRGDDPRRQLAARHLNRHQQRAEREHHERQRH